MTNHFPVVAFLPAWLDACALYRMFIPHLHTPGSRFMFNPVHLRLDDFAEASMIVVQRQCTQENLSALKRFRAVGMKIVYDLDDNLWNIPATNPGKVIFEQVKHGFQVCMEECDLLTVSTLGLKSAVRTALPSLRKEIVVVPNAIDRVLIEKTAFLQPRASVVVGYAGTNTHMGDVGDAWRAIEELLSERTENGVRFEFVGMPAPKRVLNHEQVRERNFVPVAEFFARYSTWSWDITLAPLVDNRFNRSKSCIKAIESAVLGAPCLMSEVGPYIEFVSHDPELKYLFCRTKEQWKQKIRELIHDEHLRAHLVSAMRRVVGDYYDIELVKDRWHDAFRGLTN